MTPQPFELRATRGSFHTLATKWVLVCLALSWVLGCSGAMTDEGLGDPEQGWDAGVVGVGHDAGGASGEHDAGTHHAHVDAGAENVEGSGRATYTLGTEVEASFNRSETGPIPEHGTRILCNVSHFSYDDPVVFPGESGRSHLHMFWGNTDTHAHSTASDIAERGRSTCSGGVRNRSAYWIPALLDANGEVVIPHQIITYYKSFVTDRSKIRRIPNGLEMLARADVPGFRPEYANFGNYQGGVGLSVSFPNCVAVDGAGNPVLRSEDNVSHLRYSGSGCPASHPYTIPTLTFKLRFDGVAFGEAWQLSSDSSPTQQGASFHADYIAGWEAEAMDNITECIVNHRKQCGFSSNGDEFDSMRLTPSGERVYHPYMILRDEADRTPLGAMPKNIGHGNHQH